MEVKVHWECILVFIEEDLICEMIFRQEKQGLKVERKQRPQARTVIGDHLSVYLILQEE